jgi:cation:H+ antiporter
MFNVAVIIGVSAILFAPLRFRSARIKLDVGVMIVASAAVIVCGWSGSVGRLEGALLLACLAAFLWVRVRGARADGEERDALESDAEVSIETHAKKSRGVALSLVMIFAGAGLLTGGAKLLVEGVLFIAREKGVSERVIAVTLVSAGTGLPELVTAIVAGVRKHSSVAIGNVIGSNIFNVFGILGTVALVHPLRASARLIHQDSLWMLGLSLFVLLPVLKPSRRMSKPEGVLLLIAYSAYLVWLFRY